MTEERLEALMLSVDLLVQLQTDEPVAQCAAAAAAAYRRMNYGRLNTITLADNDYVEKSGIVNDLTFATDNFLLSHFDLSVNSWFTPNSSETVIPALENWIKFSGVVVTPPQLHNLDAFGFSKVSPKSTHSWLPLPHYFTSPGNSTAPKKINSWYALSSEIQCAA